MVVIGRGRRRRGHQVEKNRDFEGKAALQLLGLPNEVTASREITKTRPDRLPARATGNSPVGLHSLLCRAVVTAREPITHTLGTGELRIQEPVAAAPPKAAAAPQPAKPAEKRLSRLEQLRLERQQAEAKPEGKP